MATKVPEETRFTVLSLDSVSLFAETVGVTGLSNALSKSVAEDTTYRIRHVIQTASQFMKHAKRRRLTTEDLNKALQICSIEPIYGYGSVEEMPFRSTNIKDGDVFFVEEKDVSVRELALGTVIPTDPGKTTVKAHWLSIEGSPIPPTNQTKSTNQGRQSISSENTTQHKTLSTACLGYYEQITTSILSDDKKCRKASLDDLKTNPKIASLLGYFVNFISTGVKTYSHDLQQLSHILSMVRSIIDNPSLYLEPYVIQLVTAVMYCLLESLAISLNPANDHWGLRDEAARILAYISRKCSNTVNYLRHQLLMTLQEVLVDDDRPYCSHYGAVVGLAELGPEGLEHFLLPYLKNYWTLLQQVLLDSSPSNAVLQREACKVYGALLQVSGCLLRSKTKGVPTNPYSNQVNNSSHPMLRANLSPWAGASMIERRTSASSQRSRSSSTNSTPPNNAYHRLYSLFGDSLIPMIAFNNWQDSLVTKNNLLRIQPLTHAYFPIRPLQKDSVAIREMILSARERLEAKPDPNPQEPLFHPGRKRPRLDDESSQLPDSKKGKRSKWSSLCLVSRRNLSRCFSDAFEVSPTGKGSVEHVSRKKGGKSSKRKSSSSKALETKTGDVDSKGSHVDTGPIKRRVRRSRPTVANHSSPFDYHLGVTL